MSSQTQLLHRDASSYSQVKKKINIFIQDVRKILPDWKVEIFFRESGYSMNSRQLQSEESFATMNWNHIGTNNRFNNHAHAVHM